MRRLPPGFVLEDGRHVIDNAPDIFIGHVVTSPHGTMSRLWQSRSGKGFVSPQWITLDISLLQTRKTSVFECLALVQQDKKIILTGDLTHIAEFLERLFRILDGVGETDMQTHHWFESCVVCIYKGALVDIDATPLPCTYWPGQLDAIAFESHKYPSYVPAYLVCSLYGDIFSAIEPTQSQWMSQRFVHVPTDILDEGMGIFFKVLPGVFVPDPIVIDLLGSAYFSPKSPLAEDLQNYQIWEPCTGSGVISIALARWGGTSICASDIHTHSVECATTNADSLQLSEFIDVIVADALPETFRGGMIVVNPPWYTGSRASNSSDWAPARRCLVDDNHSILRRILSTAVTVGASSVAYVFLGLGLDSGRQRDGVIQEQAKFGWKMTHSWHGARGLGLYRLVIH
jgi:predicted RNA methylase